MYTGKHLARPRQCIKPKAPQEKVMQQCVGGAVMGGGLSSDAGVEKKYSFFVCMGGGRWLYRTYYYHKFRINDREA